MSPPPTEQSPIPELEQTRWFAAEVQPHDSSLRAYLRGTFPSVGDVDDVMQESYLRVWKTRAVHPIHSAKAFLFTVAKRVALNIVRKKGNSPFVPLLDLGALRVIEDKPNAADALCEQEKVDLLADAVMALPSRCREIIILHKLQALPQKEVATQLGLAEKTVESQTRIGVKRCLDFLQQHGITDFYGHGD